jgi:hypothetical protein
MCDQCDELKTKIERCRRILEHRFDDLTTQRLEELIRTYEGQIAGMGCQTR